MSQKKISVQKNFGSRNFFQAPKILGLKRNLGLNKSCGSKIILGPTKYWFEKMCVSKKNWDRKKLALKNILGQKKLSVRKKFMIRKNFWSEKLLAPKKI